MLKWLIGVGLVVLIAIGIGTYYLYSNLDVLVERAIEDYGSEAVGVSVQVDRVELDLAAGRASVFGPRVSNPPGFKGANALTLDEITIDIALDSIGKRDPIVLDEIRIEAPVVFYELNEALQSNLDVLAANASSVDQSESDSSEASETTEASNVRPEVRLRIRKLRFADGRLEADTRALGGNELRANLPTAELKDIGGTRGATGGEIGSIVFREFGRQTLTAISRKTLDSLVEDEAVDKTVDKAVNKGIKAVGGFLKRLGQ